MSTSGPEDLDIQLDTSKDNYAVLGNPVSHSKSPAIHHWFAKQTGQNIYYQAIHVPRDRFIEAVDKFRELGGMGVNVTVPFKVEAYELGSELSARARQAQAVNVLNFPADGISRGDNTDGAGLIRDLENNRFQLPGARILVLGAGGAVKGVLGPILDKKPASVCIANRTMARADEILSLYPEEAGLTAIPMTDLGNAGSFDIVINGTSSGLTGDLPELPASIVSSDSNCYDLVYGDTETVFVKWCHARGVAMAIDGLGMLVEQAAESFNIWRGVMPETVPVIEALRKTVKGEG